MQSRRSIDDVPGVVPVPVAGQNPALRFHPREEPRPRIRRLDVKCRGRDAVVDGPIHRPPEHVHVVVIHAEDEAAIDHDAEVMKSLRHGSVVAAEVLAFVAAGEVGRRQRLESHEDAAESGFRGSFDEVAAENRIHGRSALEEAIHPTHAVK
jgi:hypothetical protein